MRTTAIAVLLCSLVLMHNVAGRLPKWWTKVPKWGDYPVRSARRVVGARLGLSQFSYWLYMDWARGAWWNSQRGRYTRFRVYFRIRRKSWPWNWFRCRGWVAFPKFGFPHLVGGVGGFFNNCWKI